MVTFESGKNCLIPLEIFDSVRLEMKGQYLLSLRYHSADWLCDINICCVCVCSAMIDCVSGIRWRMFVTCCYQTLKPALLMYHSTQSGSRLAIRYSVLCDLACYYVI